jgi:signal transduction histidine kinase
LDQHLAPVNLEAAVRPQLRRSWSIGQLLFAIIGLGLIPFVIFAALASADASNRYQAELRRSALDLSRALAIAVNGELDATVDAIRVYAESADADAADYRTLYDIAQRILVQRPEWSMITLADSAQNILFSTALPYGERAEPVDRESLAQAIATKRPVVSPLTMAGPGGLGLAVRVPLLRAGEVVFVLTVVVRPTVFLRIIHAQKVPDSWVVTLFDARLTRIARTKDQEGTVGKPPPPSLRDVLVANPVEGVAMSKTVEGDTVLTGFTRLPTYGWVVVVGASPGRFDAMLLRGLGYYTAGGLVALALCILLATGLSNLIARDIGRVRKLATDMGHGRQIAGRGSVVAEVDAIEEAVQETSVKLQTLVDQLRQAADEARAAGRVKDEFIAVTSHELRNPLSPIVAALHLLDMKSDEKTAKERQILHRQVAYLRRLVDDLLDVSRLTRGEMAMTLRPLDVRELVERVVAEARLGLASTVPGLALELRADAGPLWVMADDARLTQAVNNLLGNACRHAEGRPVAVELAATDTQVSLAVRDQGSGMEPRTLAQVFDPFYQSRDSSSTLRGSLGLGLAIVKSIVDSHGGKVGASSEGLGQGSRFEIVLPRVAAPESAA